MNAAAHSWGGSQAGREPARWGWLTDALAIVALAGALFGLIHVSQEWRGPLRAAVAIDLSPTSLPAYASYSLCRGLLAFALSFVFAIGYGYWAARDCRAERVLVPLLDVLQSVPVMGFMPGLVLALVHLFPRSNVGLELAAVLMIFTGQAWNMAFSFYHSLRSIPASLAEVARVYRFGPWMRFSRLELPSAATGLVWNGMMSMAGGWFFLMINEAFVLGDRDFRLPGIGSYMSEAVQRGDTRAMGLAVATMVALIVFLDQLLWRPLLAWSLRFRIEEGGPSEATSSWFLSFLRRSRLLARLRGRPRRPGVSGRASAPSTDSPIVAPALSSALLLLLLGVLAFGSEKLVRLLASVPFTTWREALSKCAFTLARVLGATALGTLLMLPLGLLIGLRPRVSRVLTPVAQVLASFPAPMLFPAVAGFLLGAGVPLGWTSVALMTLATQWYILFNVVAGATAVAPSLKEVSVLYQIRGARRFLTLYFPSLFPHLVTGWVTAAGGAWNASIVTEVLTRRGRTVSTWGLGAQITQAAEAARFGTLAASLVVMSAAVVLMNRLVWRRCYRLAETRFAPE